MKLIILMIFLSMTLFSCQHEKGRKVPPGRWYAPEELQQELPEDVVCYYEFRKYCDDYIFDAEEITEGGDN